ncbi:MAG: hypothetical protein KC561_18445 [Myxococcales bacterium]|nr:hypothetical protein [Myxococcales bacterium]
MKAKKNREISIFSLSMLDVISAAMGAVLILFIVTLQRTVPTADLDNAIARAEEAEAARRTAEERATAAETRAQETEARARLAEQRAEEALLRADEFATQASEAELRAQQAADNAALAEQRATSAAQMATLSDQERAAAALQAEEARRLAETLRAEASTARDQAEVFRTQAQIAAEQSQTARDLVLSAQQEAEAVRVQLSAMESQLELAQAQLSSVVNCEVSATDLELTFYDHEDDDGDRIRLFLNEETVRESISLHTRPNVEHVSVTLRPGINRLRILDIDPGAGGGTSGVNTSRVVISPCRGGNEGTFGWRLPPNEDQTLIILATPPAPEE